MDSVLIIFLHMCQCADWIGILSAFLFLFFKFYRVDQCFRLIFESYPQVIHKLSTSYPQVINNDLRGFLEYPYFPKKKGIFVGNKEGT